MQTKRVVVIGTSAGGIEALRTLLGALPRGFPAAIAIVIHTSPESPSVMPDIMRRTTALDVVDVTNGAALQPGAVYLAPPDHHLVLEPGRVRLTRGPRENRFRPAIDPLFRSAAQVYGPAAIGVILTGNLDDGTAGLWAIKQLGGVAIVQDPADALFPSMPQSALQHVKVDHSLPLADIPPLLARLVAGTVDQTHPADVSEEMDILLAEVSEGVEVAVWNARVTSTPPIETGP